MIRHSIIVSFFIGFIGLSQPILAQSTNNEWIAPQDLEQSILKINSKPLAAKTDKERIESAYAIQDALYEGLQNPASFNYPFDSLKYSTIAIASAKDAPLRIFTFNAILLNGKFIHLGVIQKKEKKKVKTLMMVDTLETVSKDVEDETLTLSQWVGALYYQMVPQKFKGKELFLLMGFDGHNNTSNRSILDVLYFEDGEALFGYPLFRESEEDPSPSNRVVFEYHKSAQMVLRYQPEEKVIVTDELAPAYEKVKGVRAYYIPTGDYLGYSFTGKTWVKKPLGEMNFGQDPKKIDKDKLPLPEDLQNSPTKTGDQEAKPEKSPETKPEKKEAKSSKPEPKPKKKSKSDDDDDDDDDDEDDD